MDEKMFELLEKMYIKMQEMELNMATKEELKKIEYGEIRWIRTITK